MRVSSRRGIWCSRKFDLRSYLTMADFSKTPCSAISEAASSLIARLSADRSAHLYYRELLSPPVSLTMNQVSSPLSTRLHLQRE